MNACNYGEMRNVLLIGYSCSDILSIFRGHLIGWIDRHFLYFGAIVIGDFS